MLKSILKKILINLKYFINSFTKAHICILCGGRKSRPIYMGWPYYLLRCGSCGLAFVGNLPSDADYRKFVSTGSCEREQAMSKTIWKQWQDWKIEICRKLGLFEFENVLYGTKKLLEIGPAEGKLLAVFREMGWDVSAIEAKRTFADKCRSEGYDVVCGYIEDTDIPAKSFDLIIAIHVFEHLRDPRVAAEKISRALKDDGKAIIEIPLTIERTNYSHYYFFNKKSLGKLLKESHLIITGEFKYHDSIYNYDNLAVMVEHEAAVKPLGRA